MRRSKALRLRRFIENVADHLEDAEALELYRSYQEMYGKLRKLYETEFGPLNHMHAQEGTYRWLDDPWPWEYCANREG